jgi:regulator of replication initiation timing
MKADVCIKAGYYRPVCKAVVSSDCLHYSKQFAGMTLSVKYMRMENNAALQNENAELRDELDAWRKRFSDDYEYRSGMGVVVMIQKT